MVIVGVCVTVGVSVGVEVGVSVIVDIGGLFGAGMHDANPHIKRIRR
jgi:hypothetical protein